MKKEMEKRRHDGLSKIRNYHKNEQIRHLYLIECVVIDDRIFVARKRILYRKFIQNAC